jgi:hypothetical protein
VLPENGHFCTVPFIASPSGRKRFNVLGAVNAITKAVVVVTRETYINAESISAKCCSS